MRETPVERKAASEPAGGRAAKRERRTLVRHALKEPHVETQFVPLDGGALDADKGEGDLGVPLLWRLRIGNGAFKRRTSWSTGRFVCCAVTLRIRLLSVSRIFL